jgi:hypothetical protein
VSAPTPEFWIALLAAIAGSGATVRWVVGQWRIVRLTQSAALNAQAEAQRDVADEIFELRVMQSATIERDVRRARKERRKREASSPPPPLQHHSSRVRVATPQANPIVKAVDFESEETTDMHELIELQRDALSPTRSSIRLPRPGTHHDREK